MRHQDQRPTIAILGGDTAVNNALSLLLRGAGYDTRRIERNPEGLADGLLDGVDVLLLAPSLSTRGRKALLRGVRGNPKTAQMPVLNLAAATGDIGEVLDDESSVPVAWPSPIAELAREIEAVLAPATGGEGAGTALES